MVALHVPHADHGLGMSAHVMTVPSGRGGGGVLIGGLGVAKALEHTNKRITAPYTMTPGFVEHQK